MTFSIWLIAALVCYSILATLFVVALCKAGASND